MKAKILFFASLMLLSTSLFPHKIQAQELASGSSATFNSILITEEKDNRAVILQKYLEQFHSPLAPYAQTFVSQADLYNLDWRFVAAISGVESTFGQQVPCVNAWGWGVFGNQTMCFQSYDEAIRTISKELKEKYVDQLGAQTVWEIGRYYAASPTWADRVVYFMNDMERFSQSQTGMPLSISL